MFYRDLFDPGILYMWSREIVELSLIINSVGDRYGRVKRYGITRNSRYPMKLGGWPITVREPTPGCTSLVRILTGREVIYIWLRGVVLLPYYAVIRGCPDLTQPFHIRLPASA